MANWGTYQSRFWLPDSVNITSNCLLQSPNSSALPTQSPTLNLSSPWASWPICSFYVTQPFGLFGFLAACSWVTSNLLTSDSFPRGPPHSSHMARFSLEPSTCLCLFSLIYSKPFLKQYLATTFSPDNCFYLFIYFYFLNSSWHFRFFLSSKHPYLGLFKGFWYYVWVKCMVFRGHSLLECQLGSLMNSN